MRFESKVRNRLILLAGLACLGSQAQAATPFTFMTNWYAQAEHGGFYQAQAEGLYAKEGLDVSVQMGGPQVNAIQLLAAGRAQCILSEDIAIFSARQQGVPLVMVGATFQHDPVVVIAHDDVATLKDVRNKTILISSSVHSSWWPWAKSQLGFSDEHTRPYSFNVQPFMADNNLAQQGYLTSEPYSLTKAGATFKVYPLSEAGYPPYGNSIACDSRWTDAHPDALKAFVHASMLGFKHYLDNPAPGNKLIREANPAMTEDQLDYSVQKLRSTGLVTGGDAQTGGIGVITPARMKQTWDMAVQYGLIDGAKVPLDQTYTTRFIEQAPVMP